MSWLEQDKSKNFHVRFRFGGTKFRRSLRTKSRSTGRKPDCIASRRISDWSKAAVCRSRVGLTWPLSSSPMANSTGRSVPIKAWTSARCLMSFLGHCPKTLEQTTLNCIQTHRRHFERILGASCKVEQLSVERLQHYVTKRSKEPGQRGHPVGKSTIRKEIGTLSMIWQWAVDNKHIKGAFPKKGIRYPKEHEKPPFQTWKEIVHQIEAATSEHQQAELWDCLFLTLEEVGPGLEFRERNGRQPFIYPDDGNSSIHRCQTV